MVALPQELIIYILSSLYYNAREGTPDANTLLSCALISSAWTYHAQCLLFRSVSLRGSVGGRDLQSFLFATEPSTERGRDMGRFVRSLDILVEGSDLTGITVSAFLTVLARCPGLYELILRVSRLHEFDGPTKDALRGLAHESPHLSLRALSLLLCGIQSPILYQLLEIWPSIRFLRLGIEVNAPPPPTPAPCQLYEIVLYRTPEYEIVQWLLSASEGTLHIMDFRDVPGPRFDALLRTHSPHIRSLRLMRYSLRAAAVIRLCPCLEELVLYQLSTFLALSQLPQTIEHLSFRNFTWSAIASLRTVIDAVDALPRLRVVTCDPHTAEHEDYSELWGKCLGRGIELLADAPPIWIKDDPVPVHRFPRRKSVSNFAYMN